MVTLDEIKLHNFISIMPFILIIIGLVLFYLSNKLNRKIPSQFLTFILMRVISIVLLVFSPFYFILTLSSDNTFIFFYIIIYLYWIIGIACFIIVSLYIIEQFFKRFLKIDIYVDGIKIKIGKLIK